MKEAKFVPTHTCQFIKITDEVKKEGEMIPEAVRWGVKVMCAICAERRILWTDGEVEVL